jgi:glycosyltransferase involved in cell wall biosynthesis
MKKKIFFVVPNLFVGGITSVMSALATHIDHTRYEVFMICFDGENKVVDFSGTGVTYIDLQKKNVRKGIRDLYKLIRREKPAVVFSASRHVNIFMGMMKLLFPKTMFLARETSFFDSRNISPKARVFHVLVRMFYRRVDYIICQSEAMKNKLAETLHLPGSKLFVLYNPINAEKAALHAANSSAAFAGDGTVLKLLSVGRMSSEKGYGRLLEILLQLDIPYHFIILGDGPERENVERFIRENKMTDKVWLPGTVNNVGEYIAACDIVLHASYFEGFPNIVLEAGIAGKPVIAFEAPGVGEEVITNGVNGYLVSTKEAYLSAIRQVNTQPLDKQQIVQFVMSRHDIRNICLRLESLLETAKN